MTNLHSYLYDAFSRDSRPIVQFVQWLAQSYQLPSQLRMLDIGCGTGKLLPYYADLGWDVTGVEPDPVFYEAASQLAVGQPGVQLIQGGFTDLQAHNAYNLTTAINDPLAYLLEIDQRIDAIRRVYDALLPGGVFFLEVKNFFYKLAYHEPLREEVLEVDGKRIVHIMEHEIDFHYAHWIHRDEYLIEGESEVVIKHHRVAMISPAELFYHLRQQGFERLQTYNNFDARSSQPLDEHLILVSAVKPE